MLCLDTFVIEAHPKSFEMGVLILADDVKAAAFTPVTLLAFTQKTGAAAKDIPSQLGWTIAWMGVEGTQ